MQFDGLDIIENDLRNQIEQQLNRVGILYRIYSRVKDYQSIKEKLLRKNYNENGKKMQDVIGFRIVTYFNDDVKFLFSFFKSFFKEHNSEFQIPDAEQFMPLRKNLVCYLENSSLDILNELKDNYPEELSIVDTTFEIQFRTTLSEGWHEVEHNMRYKCKPEWEEMTEFSRTLNGIYATLETSDHTLKHLFDDLAYQHYKSADWAAMIRNKFRLRFILGSLDDRIKEILNTDRNLAKELYKLDRLDILQKLMTSPIRMRITLENIVYLSNHLYLHCEQLSALTPQIMKDDFEFYFVTK